MKSFSFSDGGKGQFACISLSDLLQIKLMFWITSSLITCLEWEWNSKRLYKCHCSRVFSERSCFNCKRKDFIPQFIFTDIFVRLSTY